MSEKIEPVRVNPVIRHDYEASITIKDGWKFRLDPKDEGVGLRWFNNPAAFTEKIKVPGCWQGQGFGYDGTDEIQDFRLNVRSFRATYKGTGWYANILQIPEQWKSKRLWLRFGGAHPSADVWLNGIYLGSHSGPYIPFAFDATDAFRGSRDGFLAVRIHEKNRIFGLTYNWQGCWSGLYRNVELAATGESWIEHFWVYPDLEGRLIRFRVRRGGKMLPAVLSLKVFAPGGSEIATARKRFTGRDIKFSIPVRQAQPWSPETPNLYRIDAVLSAGDETFDATAERAGFIKLGIKGKHFLINGQPFYLRGTGDFATSPETVSPDTDRDRWRRKLKALREYGYNYVRCQSFVPAPEYFDVADEVGLLVQSEQGALGPWGGVSVWHVYGWPQPLPEFRNLMRRHWNLTVMRDINHPSANLYNMSNELPNSTLFPVTAWQCWRETKLLKPTAFVIWTDGGYSRNLPHDFVNAEAELDRKTRKPVIQHEFRWWCSFPDVRNKEKYKGPLRPYALELTEKTARRTGITKYLPQLIVNSQKLQYIEAKAKLERCRRDWRRLAGICHFTAMDCGFCSQGVIDEFYEKKYADAGMWKSVMGDTVVLIDRDYEHRIIGPGERLKVGLLISDFSHPPFEKPFLSWEFTAGHEICVCGSWRVNHKPFCTYPAGSINIELPSLPEPAAATLKVTVKDGSRMARNQWNFWLFPDAGNLPPAGIYGKPVHTWVRKIRNTKRIPSGCLDKFNERVVISENFNDEIVSYMKNGGRVLLAAPESIVRPFYPKLGLTKGRYFFTPPANYPPFNDGNSGTIVTGHPALGDFPHENWCDFQFYRMIAEMPPIDLAPFGRLQSEPVIRSFGTSFVCKALAYLLEIAVGKGGFVLCALDLSPELPEARYLLSCLISYLSSKRFKPIDQLSKQAYGLLMYQSHQRPGF
jgi:hypothetical protein